MDKKYSGEKILHARASILLTRLSRSSVLFDRSGACLPDIDLQTRKAGGVSKRVAGSGEGIGGSGEGGEDF